MPRTSPNKNDNRSVAEHRAHQYYHEVNGFLKDNNMGSLNWMNALRGNSTNISR